MGAWPPTHRREAVRCWRLARGPHSSGLLEAARARGIWVAVCDRDPAAPGFVYADRRCIVSTDDEPAIDRLASALSLDGLIAPGTDPPVAVAARVAEKLGLPHPISAATAVLATSKLRQREALAAAGVPQPRWEVAGGLDGVSIAPPLVVKAADRTGRAGLSLVRRRSDLEEALASARRASRSGAVLVEEYVEGPEVTVTGFSAGGLVRSARGHRLPRRRRRGARRPARPRLALAVRRGGGRGDAPRGRGARDRRGPLADPAA